MAGTLGGFWTGRTGPFAQCYKSIVVHSKTALSLIIFKLCCRSKCSALGLLKSTAAGSCASSWCPFMTSSASCPAVGLAWPIRLKVEVVSFFLFSIL